MDGVAELFPVQALVIDPGHAGQRVGCGAGLAVRLGVVIGGA